MWGITFGSDKRVDNFESCIAVALCSGDALEERELLSPLRRGKATNQGLLPARDQKLSRGRESRDASDTLPQVPL